MAKRFRIELGFLGLTFTVVFLACLFLWMFILGVWFGQKMMGKGPSPVAQKTLGKKAPVTSPVIEEVTPPKMALKEPPKPSPSMEVSKPAVSTSKPLAKTPVQKPPEKLPSKPSPPKTSAAVKKPSPAVSSKKPSSSPKPYYTLQVASFKSSKEAERYAQFFREKGYRAQVLKVNLPRKGTWYRVYVGRFSTLSEAKKAYNLLKQKKWVKQAYIRKVQ